MPKDHKNADAETKKLQNEGCGPSVKPPPASLPIPVTELPKFAKEEEAPPDGFRLPPRLPIGQIKIEKVDDETPAVSTSKKVKIYCCLQIVQFEVQVSFFLVLQGFFEL